MGNQVKISEPVVERKPRGAFYTPPELSDFVAEWAIRDVKDRILEPSCGEAAFLLSASRRLRGLGSANSLAYNLCGVDIFSASINKAREVLADQNIDAQLFVNDFFTLSPPTDTDGYDAVIGNPPYIRYQQFSGVARARALEAALRQGIRLSGLASSWAAFVIHAASFLKPDGRLGLVIPAELLSVNYAAEIRRFLLRRFKTVRLVLFEEKVFPNVLEEVVLLLAEGHGGGDRFELFQAKSLADLSQIAANSWSGYVPVANGKWTPALLSSDALEVYQRILAEESFENFSKWGTAYLGAVTGSNKYFAISKDTAKLYSLSRNELLIINPPGSRHLRGLNLSKEKIDILAQNNEKCFLFYPSDNPSQGAARYIEYGKEIGIDLAYKCRIRTPWWRVPLVAKPDLIFTYMNHHQPQIIQNEASAHIINSVYGIRLNNERIELGKKYLPIIFMNSFSLLGAEINGRAYGGGLLKHEPREVTEIPLPSLSLVEALASELSKSLPDVAELFQNMGIEEVIKLVDKIILKDALGLSVDCVEIIRGARQHLLGRRLSRGKKNGSN